MLRHFQEKNDLSCFKTLLVTGLLYIIPTSLLPPIQSCSSEFWAWSCIASNFDKGWRGDHKHKIMDRPFIPKYGTVFQVLIVTGCSIEQTWKGLAILVQIMLIVQNNDRNRLGKPRSLWGLSLTVTAWLFGRGGENERTFHKFSKKRNSFEFGLILRIRQIWKDDFSLSR